MFLVVHLDGHFDESLIVAGYLRPCVTDPGLDLRDRVGDTGEHPGSILSGGKNRYGLDLVLFILRPVDVHDPVFIDHQLANVLALLIVNNDALPQRYIAYDLFTPKRIAAACTRRQQIIHTLYDDRVLT